MSIVAAVAFVLVTQSPTDRATTWLKNAWSTVQQQGKAAADRIVRESPERFKEIKKTAVRVCDDCSKKIAGLDLESRKRLILQLWQVRGSVNLLSLTNPNTLAIIGLDPDDVIALNRRVSGVWTNVAKAYPDVVKSLKLSK